MSNRKKVYTQLTGGVSRVKLTRDPEVSDDIRLVTFGFSSYAPANVTDLSSELTAGNKFLQDENAEPKVIGQVLNFPNPFRLENGTAIRYKLSKNMEIEFLLYDMMSNLIFDIQFEAGAVGGTKDYNELLINKDTFQQHIPAGIYFYYLRHKGSLMAKGKIAVIP